jgi:hypothetical protein
MAGADGGSDPFCTRDWGTLSAGSRANCRVSGSVAEPHPISSYGLDVQPPSNTTNVAEWITYELQSVGAVLWEILLYGIHGVLLLLQWAFSLDLVGKGLGQVGHALAILHDDVFGTAWLDVALAVAALWGIWNGLVRRKTIETLGGLAGTLALMIAALVLISRPGLNLVNQATSDVNQASLGTLSALSHGTVSRPARSLAGSEADLFTALVLKPWCALEFGAVSDCGETARGAGSTTLADVWLSTPANSSYRQGLYQLATTGSTVGSSGHVLDQLLKAWLSTQTFGLIGGGGIGDLFKPFGGFSSALSDIQSIIPRSLCSKPGCPAAAIAAKDISKNSQLVHPQEPGGPTFDRLTMLAMVVVGLSGAIAVLLYIGIKLLFAAVKILLLILGASVMVMIAAFGESGRATSIAWGRRLAGAILTKLVFAVFLALVLLTAGLMESLATNPGIGWFSVWLLTIVFWWGIFFERHRLVQFLEVDKRATEGSLGISGHGAPFRLAGVLFGGYYAARALRDVGRGLMALPRAIERRSLDRQIGATRALREGDTRELGARARRSIELEDRERLIAAKAAVAAQDERKRALAKLQPQRRQWEGKVQGYEWKLRNRDLEPWSRRATELSRDAASAELAGVTDQIAAEQRAIDAAEPGVIAARSTISHLEGGNRVIDQRDVDRALQQRRRDVEGPFPEDDTSPEFERALRAAGIRPSEYRVSHPDGEHATRAQQKEFARRAKLVWERDRGLFAGADSTRPDIPYARAQLQAGWTDARRRGNPEFQRARARAEEERHRIKAERRLRSRPRR